MACEKEACPCNSSFRTKHGRACPAEVVGLSPEGRGELEAHVSVPNEWLKQLPPLTDEDKRSLEEIAPYVGRKCARPASLPLVYGSRTRF